jgi:hypothetical protein
VIIAGLLAVLSPTAPPTRVPISTSTGVTACNDLGDAPAYDDDDSTDYDDALGYLDFDGDDDCLPPGIFALDGPGVAVRIFTVTPAMPTSVALAPLFRPPRHAAV